MGLNKVEHCTSAFALFYLQDPSLLEFQRRVQEKINKNNLSTVFNVQGIPSDTQLRDVIDIHSNKPIQKVFKEYFYLLQRGKHLKGYQFLNDNYLIVLDGSEYFTSESIYCSKCLVKQDKQKNKRYYHQILQSTLVHPSKREIIPLAPEFIHNGNGQKKQDCERNAGKRVIRTIKQEHPHLPVIIVGDSLYSNKPFLDELHKAGFSYILVAKPKDHKSLYSDIDGLKKEGLLDTYTKKGKNREYVYEWTNEVYLNGNPDSPQVNFCQLRIIRNGKVTFRNSWITDIIITKENIEDIVKGGRARWKIENEGFNTLKNHGYHLEHNFGHGKYNLSETFFLLNLLAFFFHQIFQISDGLYQTTRGRFSARKEFWNCIRSTFRLFIFISWEQILERINGPPQRIE
ncbi:MAG: transposase [bacterium]